MKIIAYAGVSAEAISLGIVYYNRLKRAGRGKKRLAYGSETILVTYTDTKKDITIISTTTVLTTSRGCPSPVTPSVTTSGKLYTISRVTGISAIPDDPLDVVTPVVASSAVYSGLGVTLTSLIPKGPIGTPGDAATEGQLIATAKQYGNATGLLMSAIKRYANGYHFDELNEALTSQSLICRITEGNALYDIGVRAVRLEGPGFLGTDSDGNDVVVLRVATPYKDTEQANELLPLPASFADIVQEFYEDVELSNFTRRYFKEYYVAVSLYDYAKTAVGESTFLDAETGANVPTYYDVHSAYDYITEPFYYIHDLYPAIRLYEHSDVVNVVGDTTTRVRITTTQSIDWRRVISYNSAILAVQKNTLVEYRRDITVINTGSPISTSTVTENNAESLTVDSNSSYRISFDQGVFSVVDEVMPALHSLNTTGNSVYDYFHTFQSSLQSRVISFDENTSGISIENTEPYQYRGDEYNYEAPYADNLSVTSQSAYTSTEPPFSPPDIVGSDSFTPFTQNRELRSWYHYPDLAGLQPPDISTRFLVRTGAGTDKVHIYAGEFSGDRNTQVFINGVQLYTSSDGYLAGADTSRVFNTYRLAEAEASYIYDEVTYSYQDTSGAVPYNELTIDRDSNAQHSVVRYTPAGEDLVVSSIIDYIGLSDVFPVKTALMHPPVENIPPELVNKYAPSVGGGFYPFKYNYTQVPDTISWNSSSSISSEGYTLFPTVWSAPDTLLVIHWKRNGDEGLCVCAYDISNDEYEALLLAYLDAKDDTTVTEAVLDSMLTALYAHIQVIYNNFASPRLMAILQPGFKYTIY